MLANNGHIPANMDVTKAETPLSIAIVYSRVPFPMMRGDQLTVSHLISFLADRGHDVHLISLELDGNLTEKQNKWLQKKCSSIRWFKQSKLRSLINMARGLLKLNPLQVGYFTNYKLNHLVKTEINKGSYDIVYTYYLRSAPAVPDLFSPNSCHHIEDRKVAAFLAMQLSQTLNTKRIYENAKTGLLKVVYWVEWRLLRRYEARIWTKFTRSVLIGQKDVDAVTAACIEEKQPKISNWQFGAHGTDVSKFKPAKPEDRIEGRVVFSGSMIYQPNCQAVLWFVENCWENLKSRNPNATLVIVGRDPLPEIRALDERSDIEVTGTVEDVGKYIRSASVCINPMLAAGGMQNKLIEYLASAVPVVATSIANEGIMAPNKIALLERNTPGEIVDAIHTLLNDQKYADQLAQEGRKFVLENWTWESHFHRLEDSFYSALNDQPLV